LQDVYLNSIQEVTDEKWDQLKLGDVTGVDGNAEYWGFEQLMQRKTVFEMGEPVLFSEGDKMASGLVLLFIVPVSRPLLRPCGFQSYAALRGLLLFRWFCSWKLDSVPFLRRWNNWRTRTSCVMASLSSRILSPRRVSLSPSAASERPSRDRSTTRSGGRPRYECTPASSMRMVRF
jgi:hypothetical protein